MKIIKSSWWRLFDQAIYIYLISCWVKSSCRVELSSQAFQLDSSSWVQLLNFTRHFFKKISTQLDAIRNSDHLQARWARWASCSSCSLWSLLIQAIRANTSRLWLHNNYLIICKRVLTLNSLLRFSFWKSLFFHVFSLHNKKLYLALQKSSWAYKFWACCHTFLWTLQSLAKEMSCWQQIWSLHRVYASQSQVQSYFLDDEVKKNKDRTRSRSSWAAEHLQADVRDLRESYSSAKSICVSEE